MYCLDKKIISHFYFFRRCFYIRTYTKLRWDTFVAVAQDTYHRGSVRLGNRTYRVWDKNQSEEKNGELNHSETIIFFYLHNFCINAIIEGKVYFV